MKILLDECVDQRLRRLIPAHDCHTAGYAGLSGLKNGALLAAAEAAGFEVLLTVDQGLSHQQNLSLRQIAIVVLCAPSNRLADLARLIPAALLAMERLAPGHVVRIE
jgi:hypothetical protein